MAFTTIDPSLTPSVQQNLLINGGFEIWQRGTSFVDLGNNLYGPDRWKSVRDTLTTYTISKETSVTDSGAAALKCVLTKGSGTYWYMEQSVENYQEYRGKTLTVSARVKTNVATGVKIKFGDGVTDSFSSYHTGDNTWQTLSVTKTMDASATAVIVRIGFIASDLQTSTTYFDSAMLVLGSQPATYVARPFAQELALCQRYCEKSYDVGTNPGTATSTDNEVVIASQNQGTPRMASGIVKFKVTKYSSPTVTLYSCQDGSTGKWTWYTTAGAGIDRTSTTLQLSKHGFNVAQSVTTEAIAIGQWLAEAEI